MAGIQWHSFFFLLFALAACACAVAVVISENVVRMAVYLVASLAAVAGLFFLAGADFLGAVQLMVYVGGTLVLLVFGVMLTARGPFVAMRTSAGQWIVALLIGGSLLAVLLQTVLSLRPVAVSADVAARAETPATAAQLGMGLIGVRTDVPPGAAGYLLPFEIISIHLLVVLVGAAYLARAKRRVAKEPGTGGTQPIPERGATLAVSRTPENG